MLKTGQTLCYDERGFFISCTGTGQDGEFQKGGARSYTDNGLTITDNTTGLEWEKLGDQTVTSTCATINDWDTVYTWLQAFQKIAALNTASFGGHNDWRLPNLNELQSLADYGKRNPAIDIVFRTGNDGTGDSFTKWSLILSSFYWSSTTYLGTEGIQPGQLAWLVDFGSGFVFANDKGNNTSIGGVFGKSLKGGVYIGNPP